MSSADPCARPDASHPQGPRRSCVEDPRRGSASELCSRGGGVPPSVHRKEPAHAALDVISGQGMGGPPVRCFKYPTGNRLSQGGDTTQWMLEHVHCGRLCTTGLRACPATGLTPVGQTQRGLCPGSADSGYWPIDRSSAFASREAPQLSALVPPRGLRPPASRRKAAESPTCQLSNVSDQTNSFLWCQPLIGAGQLASPNRTDQSGLAAAGKRMRCTPFG